MIAFAIRAAARPLVFAFAAMALAGCSSLSLPTWLGGVEKPKPAELTANPATLGVRQAWSANVGAINFALTTNVQGNAITVAASDGSVVSLDATDGHQLWRANAGAPIAAGVGSDGKVSAVVTNANELVAFEGGKEIWRQRLPVGVYTAPFVAGARVFILQADRSVVGFDGQTGRKLWTYTRAASSEPLVLSHPGVMLAVGDTLLVGQSGRLAGLNPLTGAVRWEAPIAVPRGINDVERLVDLVGSVSRIGTDICARAFQAAVGCVDTNRANVRWTKTASGSEGVSGDNDFVFGTESNGTVIAWKRTNGDRAWSTDLLSHRGLTAPFSLGRAVVVGDSFGYVHFLSREDGKLMNRLDTDKSAVIAAPVLAGNTLVVVTKAGGVFGIVPQ
ncbi:MAG TPA: outer membrane protein assembly factor BamB [Ramlibacter sp.]|nr:outer membrane protein assembly factor BamB [Ramlibacter sp.]